MSHFQAENPKSNLNPNKNLKKKTPHASEAKAKITTDFACTEGTRSSHTDNLRASGSSRREKGPRTSCASQEPHRPKALCTASAHSRTSVTEAEHRQQATPAATTKRPSRKNRGATTHFEGQGGGAGHGLSERCSATPSPRSLVADQELSKASKRDKRTEEGALKFRPLRKRQKERALKGQRGSDSAVVMMKMMMGGLALVGLEKLAVISLNLHYSPSEGISAAP